MSQITRFHGYGFDSASCRGGKRKYQGCLPFPLGLGESLLEGSKQESFREMRMMSLVCVLLLRWVWNNQVEL